MLGVACAVWTVTNVPTLAVSPQDTQLSPAQPHTGQASMGGNCVEAHESQRWATAVRCSRAIVRYSSASAWTPPDGSQRRRTVSSVDCMSARRSLQDGTRGGTDLRSRDHRELGLGDLVIGLPP